MLVQDPDPYFAGILYTLMALAFIVLILIFLYMIYGKEEKAK